MMDEFLNLPTDTRRERLRRQEPDLDRAYRVLSELRSRVGHADLYRLVTSEYVLTGVVMGTFDDSIRMVETLILPYADEFTRARDDSVRKTIRGMTLRSKLMGYQGSFFDSRSSLSRDPEIIQRAINELRVITSVWSLDLPRHEISEIISRTNSPPTLQLTLNTPLYLLLQELPDRGDDIITVIGAEREIDGDRIAAMIDSAGTPMRSGAL
jgi:hypothetical protein